MVWRVSGWPARCTWPGVGGWRNRHIGGHFGADGLQNILIWTATAAPDRTNSGIQIGGYARVGRPIRFWDDIHGSIPTRCHASQQARALLPGTEQAAVAWHHSGWIAPTGPGTRPKIELKPKAPRLTGISRKVIRSAGPPSVPPDPGRREGADCHDQHKLTQHLPGPEAPGQTAKHRNPRSEA